VLSAGRDNPVQAAVHVLQNLDGRQPQGPETSFGNETVSCLIPRRLIAAIVRFAVHFD
jgi:hypothetical protein